METITLNISNVWMMICTALVFFMHLGFSFLEIGLCRQKNTVNILFKNIFIICCGLLLYFFIGFNLMYPSDFFGGIIAKAGFTDLFGLNPPMDGHSIDLSYNKNYTFWTDFLFQAMFAATAATIVSGAVAERIKIGSFMVFTLFYIGLVYPIIGSWVWGGGFLNDWGFYDFAGSTVVHSVGGWAAIVAVYLLGSRTGKFSVTGKPRAIPGHNLPLATAGVLILWLGWFGFNGGSVLSSDPRVTSITLVTTSLSAATGGISAFLLSTILFKNYDLTMTLNGILGGLVGITAGANIMSPIEAIIIGAISGILIVLAIPFIDKLKIDDPVGAIPVHLVCGVWGTLSIGIFGEKLGFKQLGIQFLGITIISISCMISAFVLLYLIKKYKGLRVKKEEEIEGLDLHEHGAMSAYPDFRLNQH